MIGVVVGAAVALVVVLTGMPAFIRYLQAKRYGQYIREDGPTSHHVKLGTPTMGGFVILTGAFLGWVAAHLALWRMPSWSALLVIFLMLGMGAIGFADDYLKIARKHNLGLTSGQKLLGQFSIATIFAVAALQRPDAYGQTPASTAISWARDVPLDLAVLGGVGGTIAFVLWANLIIAGMSNGTNLTDGLDGLLTGLSAIVFAAYTLMTFFQFSQHCGGTDAPGCYEVRDPLDLAIICAAIAGACIGFLWWNASPAKIFMGDTGSLAIGAALAGVAIVSRTELLVVVIAGVFVLETLSVMIQVASFKSTGKRVFKMTPIHHHFEMLGWPEVNIVIRFWILGGLCVGVGMALFYADWLVR
ncbi:Phospho-N-acetylmuramoyl-pentapeptide-transferase [Kytococcus aerolatus]|uniref:Phospho-N-acetylmuramoyl-pentapeptide-transferase n=1 Tax=Kytococcus aerolatus TaxID=592308 RepID=A0A212T5A8_9MICO|nr:phospho-N-acetylmuramoyl-pentapeptide-transferase [Kytococcus aerolatus]SNC60944.1 Phospho-N-acetylmuramoyl-pentapeptide-transferase [Kytococcus aerolatus]